MRVRKRVFNLERQYVFYATYHRHPVNIILHFFCIDLLNFCVQVALTQFTPSINMFLNETQLEHSLFNYMELNLALLGALVMSGWYISLEPFAGTIAALKILASCVLSSLLVMHCYEILGQLLLWIAMAVIMVCLVLLEVGHKFFEGRSPAVVSQLDESFLTAPLFIVLQSLFFCGYRKELNKMLKEQIETNVALLDQK